jgi:hypothetical protein
MGLRYLIVNNYLTFDGFVKVLNEQKLINFFSPSNSAKTHERTPIVKLNLNFEKKESFCWIINIDMSQDGGKQQVEQYYF